MLELVSELGEPFPHPCGRGTQPAGELVLGEPAGQRQSTAGKKRETIRKSVKYLAAVLDFAGVEPNPARDRQRVRLPYESCRR